MEGDNPRVEPSKNVLRAVGARISNGKNNKSFKLLYCASIDSNVAPDVEKFHLKCDSKKPTLTILHGKHNTIFGGYTGVEWSSSKHDTRKDTEAFLFYMNDNEGAVCKFFPVKDNKTDLAITCDANFGPTFGANSFMKNYDLQVFKKDSKPESKQKGNFFQLNGVFDIGNVYNTNDADGRKVKSKDINSGMLTVQKIEVLHVIDDEYHEPWRTQLKDEHVRQMKKELTMKEPIPGLGIKKYNILLIGTIGVGKSSFYNTLATVFGDKVKTHAPARESKGSVTNEVKAYTIETEKGEELCVRIFDIRGFESQRGYEHELAHILNGQLRIGYKFPEQMSEPTEEDKRKPETLDDEIHLLCFLTGPPENYNNAQIKEIDNIKHTTDLKGLPLVVVATKFDEQCLNITEDVDHLYKCKKSKDTTEDIAKFFKIQENHVLPVVNYTSENVKSKGKDRLALQAFHKMIEVTEDFLAQHKDKCSLCSAKVDRLVYQLLATIMSMPFSDLRYYVFC
ncbi:uncharacterized protein LOC123566532, partial [Mercenaria mercenaria]|uniref:uncharacterized protein LOC123566532 n=1 Tax=Mercenaria mercenaria TaxID=6596 RepID=UPI00234F0949